MKQSNFLAKYQNVPRLPPNTFQPSGQVAPPLPSLSQKKTNKTEKHLAQDREF